MLKYPFIICIVKNRYRFAPFDRQLMSSARFPQTLSSDNNFRDKFTPKNYCPNGFRFHHGLCQDIDECLLDENACDSNQICINDSGGYHCDCKIGFNQDATTNACIGKHIFINFMLDNNILQNFTYKRFQQFQSSRLLSKL